MHDDDDDTGRRMGEGATSTSTDRPQCKSNGNWRSGAKGTTGGVWQYDDDGLSARTTTNNTEADAYRMYT